MNQGNISSQKVCVLGLSVWSTEKKITNILQHTKKNVYESRKYI